MSAVPWNTLSETWTAPASRPALVRVPLNQDEVRTKVSGAESTRALPDVAPDSQHTADASGPRLLIPALSLRAAIAGLDAQPGRAPYDSHESFNEDDDVSDIAPTIPLERYNEKRYERTDTLPRRRPWFRSSVAVWCSAIAMLVGGLYASTTDTAEMIAGRLYVSIFQNEAEVIPAAAADSTPAAMPAVETRVALEAPTEPIVQAAAAPVTEKAAVAKTPVAKRPVPVRVRR